MPHEPKSQAPTSTCLGCAYNPKGNASVSPLFCDTTDTDSLVPSAIANSQLGVPYGLPTRDSRKSIADANLPKGSSRRRKESAPETGPVVATATLPDPNQPLPRPSPPITRAATSALVFARSGGPFARPSPEDQPPRSSARLQESLSPLHPSESGCP